MHNNKDHKPHVIRGKYHSLFNKPDVLTQVVNNYKLMIGQFGEEENGLHEIYRILLDAKEPDTLELRIQSPGGLATECQALCNIMDNHFKERSIAYIDSHASSAGAIIFSSAYQRVIYENSRLMYHDYKGGMMGSGNQMEDKILFQNKHLRDWFRTMTVDKGFLTEEEFKMMLIGKEYWLDAEDMCERGIATHIVIDGVSHEAAEYKKILKQRKKDKKKALKELNGK